jgi:hypothetical protein
MIFLSFMCDLVGKDDSARPVPTIETLVATDIELGSAK